jgi:peptidoglycan/LPS O-acetylase OafA/YrhL
MTRGAARVSSAGIHSLPPPPRRVDRARPLVAPTPAATPRLTHLRSLDGLRGLAVLAVVVYHFAPEVAPGGFLGVDLFFVLSGFLITSLLVNEWDSTRHISLGSFWARRARRLVPALLLVLGAVALYALTLGDQVEARRISIDGLASLGYVANWHFIGSGQAYIDQFLHHTVSPLRHMWSLAIEEQFYLVWPLIVLLVARVTRGGEARPARRRRRFRGALVGVCVGLGTLSFLRMITLFDPGGDLNRVYYGTDSRAFILLIGALLGALSFGAPAVARRLRPAVVVVGCAAALGLGFAIAELSAESSWLYEGGYGLVAVAMAAVLLAAAQPGANPLSWLLERRALVGLGLISYGVYLWHWPVSLWVTDESVGVDGVALFVLRAALTLAAAIASYYLVELPIRSGRVRFSRRPLIAAVALVVSVITLLLVPALAFPARRSAPDVAAAAREVVNVGAGYNAAPRCDGGALPVRIPGERPLVIQLEGNSLAGELRSCLADIMRPRGVRFETVNPPDFLLCDVLPSVERQVQRTRPDAGMLHGFFAYNDECGGEWHWPVDAIVKIWRDAGMHVYLVPSTPFAPGSPEEAQMSAGPHQEAEHYRSLAASDPEHITVLDAGAFVRTDAGEYVWRMPCLPGGEAGCAADGTVGVRYVDGLHFCTDVEFAGRGCTRPRYEAGQRRAAASVAVSLIPSLQELAARRSGVP